MACIHTPALPSPGVEVSVSLATLEGRPDDEGRACTWAEEALVADGARLLGGEPPEACAPLTDRWQTVDVLGRNGPFVSVVVETGGCCPPVRQARCATFDVVNRREVTVTEYHEKVASRRLRRAATEAARLGVVTPLDEAQFLVRGQHVTFCAWTPSGARVDVPAP